MASKRYDRPTARKARPPRRLTWKAKLYRAARRKDPWFTGSNGIGNRSKVPQGGRAGHANLILVAIVQKYDRTDVRRDSGKDGRMKEDLPYWWVVFGYFLLGLCAVALLLAAMR